MKRRLQLRGLTLQLVPLLAVLAIAFVFPRFGLVAMQLASLPMCVKVALSVRDGAAINFSRVVERKDEAGVFWVCVGTDVAKAGALVAFPIIITRTHERIG